MCVYVLRNNLSLYLHDTRCAIYDAQVHASFDYIFNYIKMHYACTQYPLLAWADCWTLNVFVAVFVVRFWHACFSIWIPFPFSTHAPQKPNTTNQYYGSKKILFERNHFKSQHTIQIWSGSSSKANQFLFPNLLWFEYVLICVCERARVCVCGMCLCVEVWHNHTKKPKTSNESCIIIEYRRQKQKIINHKLKAINNYRRGKTLSKFCEWK